MGRCGGSAAGGRRAPTLCRRSRLSTSAQLNTLYPLSTELKTRVNAVAMQAGCISLYAWLVSISYWMPGKVCKIRIKHPVRNMVKNGTCGAQRKWGTALKKFLSAFSRTCRPTPFPTDPGILEIIREGLLKRYLN